jgi:hypothetical protein
VLLGGREYLGSEGLWSRVARLEDLLCDCWGRSWVCRRSGTCGGAMFGSGTQGLQRRTRSPPPRVANCEELLARRGSIVGRVWVTELEAEVSVGGWTINW